MSFLDRLITGGGVVLLGVAAKNLYRDAQETKRRKDAPLRFDDGLTQSDFVDLARDIGKRTPRVKDVVVTGMTVTLHVRSNSGLSTWAAQVDFSDYGHLTGAYWLHTDNSDSLIPEHFADALRAEIKRRVTKAAR